ncbi:unnamed protein product [marine sediment metagenome]|uniref:Uncharacterized protein n=1 Tax=marine sediment metagenome TaxID=412755 RepID=X1NR66_9ZZZZ
MMKQIKVRFEGIEVKDGNMAITYIPDQTQILQAGKRYEIIIEGLSFEKWEGKQRSEAER